MPMTQINLYLYIFELAHSMKLDYQPFNEIWEAVHTAGFDKLSPSDKKLITFAIDSWEDYWNTQGKRSSQEPDRLPQSVEIEISTPTPEQDEIAQPGAANETKEESYPDLSHIPDSFDYTNGRGGRIDFY